MNEVRLLVSQVFVLLFTNCYDMIIVHLYLEILKEFVCNRHLGHRGTSIPDIWRLEMGRCSAIVISIEVRFLAVIVDDAELSS